LKTASAASLEGKFAVAYDPCLPSRPAAWTSIDFRWSPRSLFRCPVTVSAYRFGYLIQSRQGFGIVAHTGGAKVDAKNNAEQTTLS